jgi:hypothetical protein
MTCEIKQNILFELILLLIIQIYLEYYKTSDIINYLMLMLCFSTSISAKKLIN